MGEDKGGTYGGIDEVVDCRSGILHCWSYGRSLGDVLKLGTSSMTTDAPR